MAMKRARRRAKKSPPLRICFERILPDRFDTDRMLRRSMREAVMSEIGRRDGATRRGVARMAVQVSKQWQPGSIVTCRFLDGQKNWKTWVEDIAHTWEDHANITFRFSQKKDADIRISFFADDGSWSAVGRDALNTRYFKPSEPTMNFGWMSDELPVAERRSVVLHEFGHALGCIHEHSSPTFTRKWNRAAVIEAFSHGPDHWTLGEIQSNVLNKYSPRGIKATRWDPKSIMLYSFDAALFTDGKGPTNENTRLSATDKKHIRQMYPKRPAR